MFFNIFRIKELNNDEIQSITQQFVLKAKQKIYSVEVKNKRLLSQLKTYAIDTKTREKVKKVRNLPHIFRFGQKIFMI